MDSETNIPRLLLFFLRILQCSGSLIVIITEILRHTHVVYLIEWEMKLKAKKNKFELFFEYFVMNLGFVMSVIHILRFNQRLRQYRCDVFIDCVLMNAWMIFGILRLSPQFEDTDLLTCGQYGLEKRKGCITYISMLTLGFFISASYFLTAMVSTWIRAGKDSSVNPINNPINSYTDHNSFDSSKSSLNRINRTELNEFNGIRNSQIISDIPEVITREGEECTEVSLKEFIERNKHLAHLCNENLEFNRTDGTIVILRKPSPPFLSARHGPPSRNSSSYESSLNSKYMSEYSLDSSFSRIYGSIIIPRKYVSTASTPSTQSETDTSSMSKRDSSIIIGRNETTSTYSEISTSTLSDKTSRSSGYDGSIIIKFVA